MKPWRLSRRLSAVFAVPLLACCGASVWLQMHAEHRKEQEDGSQWTRVATPGRSRQVPAS